LNAFKDVFLSHGPTSLSAGEPYADIEALLAALSTGPVAIGDQIGCTRRDIVMRTCREDGVLVKPDVPIAAVDHCFYRNAFFELIPLIGETYSQHPAGRWVYVATFNACQKKKDFSTRVELRDLGAVRPPTAVLAYDWRRRTWNQIEPDGGWEVSLPFQDFDYRILCPLLDGDITVFGDVGKYASAGDRRIAGITDTGSGIQFMVLGSPGRAVEIHGYSRRRPANVTAWLPGVLRSLPAGAGGESWAWRDDGLWVIRVRVGREGHVLIGVDL
jgi:hypothetical protein